MHTRTLFLTCIALFAAQATGRAAVIVDQSSGQTGGYIGSQQYPDQPSYDQSAFDDFTIGSALGITSLTVFGREFYGGPSQNLSVIAGIYASPDLTTSPILSASGAQVGSDLFFDFGGATLAAGTYWIGAYVVRPSSAGAWNWDLRQPISGSQARWHNPAGGFGRGTSPLRLGDVLEEADLAFILEGGGAPATSVGGSVAGMTPRLVVCQNVTTRRRVVIKDRSPVWNCEAAGLVISPGDTIRQKVTGKANTPPPSVGGSVNGVSPTEVVCRSRQRVLIMGGAPAWNCETAGLVVTPGRNVTQVVTGTAH